MGHHNSTLAALARFEDGIAATSSPALRQAPIAILQRHLLHLWSTVPRTSSSRHAVELAVVSCGVVTALERLQAIFERASF